jgi:hypothetical protein
VPQWFSHYAPYFVKCLTADKVVVEPNTTSCCLRGTRSRVRYMFGGIRSHLPKWRSVHVEITFGVLSSVDLALLFDDLRR